MNIKAIILTILLVSVLVGCVSQCKAENDLKTALNDDFLIGVAVSDYQSSGNDSLASALVEKHFNSVVAENCMKSVFVQPQQGVFDFEAADRFVSFGEKYNQFIVGHTLIWHSQAPSWFFVDEKGRDVSREELISRMKNHIETLVKRYKGRIHGWDVVNEAIEDDGSYRENKFYQIIGEEYIELAFRMAREADRDVELYYNDYNMVKPSKREGVAKMIRNLQLKGISVDGIGIQGHFTMGFPALDDLEKSIEYYANLGCKVMISELDVSVLPNPWESSAEVTLNFEYNEQSDPYRNGMPQDVSDALDQRYLDLFTLFMKHSDKISRITLWGINDANSWKNDWPIVGRTDYPLLFNRDYQPKPVVDMIIQKAQNNN